jgi:L-ascorbate metabolism protein UlaG (beta-lactamase superfamily)
VPPLLLKRRARASALIATLALAAGCDHLRLAGNTTRAFFTEPIRPAPRADPPTARDARLGVAWGGHATTVVQIDDRVLLTDPVFTPSVGQLARRLVAPGITPASLPAIDVVLLSHVHVDHLSLGSIEAIAPKVRQLVAPAGGLVYLTDFDFDADDLAPWASADYRGLRVTAVPVDHGGGRYGIDGAWSHAATAYVVEYHGLTVYFGGDTAYRADLFRPVRARFPRIDLALLGIGPNTPRAILAPHHMSADDAAQAFVELGAARLVPIHFDTMPSSLDAPGEALRMLREGLARRGVDEERVVVLAIGERRGIVGRD